MKAQGDRVSGTTRFMVGKMYPGAASPIRDITVRGKVRIVHLQNGQMLRQTKKDLVRAFQTVLKGEQFHKTVQKIKPLATGGVVVKVGGDQKGIEKHYQSKARAISALRKRYGQS